MTLEGFDKPLPQRQLPIGVVVLDLPELSGADPDIPVRKIDIFSEEPECFGLAASGLAYEADQKTSSPVHALDEAHRLLSAERFDSSLWDL